MPAARMTDSNSLRSPVTIEFQPLGRRAVAPYGGTVLRAAHEAGLALLSVCGGAGLCDSCRVRIVAGDVSPTCAIERERLDAEDLLNGYRLACQVHAFGDLVVDVPAESVATQQRLQLEWDPGLCGGGPGETTPGVVSPVRAPAVETGELGVAVDVGTTKVAAYLVDLATGCTCAADALPNPQVAYGEDLISRVAFADRTAGGAQLLHDVIARAIDELVRRLCATADLPPNGIRHVVLVGNTVMHHLVAGLPVTSLGRAPYTPLVSDGMEVAAADIGLSLGDDVRAYLPPNIAGYVGADHVAVLMAIGADASAGNDGRTRLAIDIGTNTEVSLLANGRLLCCSCASGPAFEGAHISAGMRAAAGAVERVRVIGGEVRCQVIGDCPPIGICGSGVLDAVAELVVHGAIDRHGGLRREHPLISTRGGEAAFLLAPAAATGHNRDLAFTRRDVGEVQLAKAAIRTGIDVLLDRAKIRAAEIDQVIVAGAFGAYIDLGSARRIGMLPDLPPGRFRQVGNAAGAGARRLLMARSDRIAAARVARRAEHVDLTAEPRFMDMFASALSFDG
jgi:uncharacterized 2Fe-2S/4Fe-4S cluster protein (DUF4445 family)